MFKTKLSLLIIAVFLLNIDFLLSYPAFATDAFVNGGESAKFASRMNSTGSFSRASNPECKVFSTTAVLAAIPIIIGMVWTGITLLVSSLGLFTAIVIAGMIAAFVVVWKTVGAFIVCNHSFVKHPVIRDQDGKKKDFLFKDNQSTSKREEYVKCVNKNYQTEDEYLKCLGNGSVDEGRKIGKDILNFTDSQPTEEYYWPKNSTQYSDYIEVCFRNPLTFGSVLSEISEFDIREKEFEYVTKSIWPRVDGGLGCKVLKAGESASIYSATFKAVKKVGRLCVELDSIKGVGTVWPRGVNIGCTDLPPEPQAPMCEKSIMKFKNKNTGTIKEVSLSSQEDYKTVIRKREKDGYLFQGYNNKGCFGSYVSGACYDQAGTQSLSPLPITSMVVQCVKESLDNLVAGRGSPDGKSFLSVAQKRLKATVTVVLVLALMLFAMKAISGGVRNPQEVYMLIIKFAFVVYLTTGNAMSHYYGELTRLSNGLSEIVLKASSESKNICNYEAKSYNEDFAYLAPWDRLDCRLLFYLGAPLEGVGGKIGTGGVATLTVLFGAAPALLVAGSIFGIIFAGGQILIALVAILMGFLMMAVVLWICYVFILSLIALSVIVILSPLFIPMILFQATKGYFDGWLRELITYSLYPVILFSFLSFMFVACDKIFYKGLSFEKENLTIFDQKKQWFKLKGNGCESNPNTLACALQNYTFVKGSILGLFDFTYIEFEDSLVGELLKLSLILLLFYHFLNVLPQMAAELAGNHRAALGSGSTPGQLVGKAISAAQMAAGGTASIAGAVARKIGGASSKGGGGDSKGESGGGGKSDGGSSESIKPKS
ncbi:MAG: type IV secretion system protein [Wolbachia endosymbiont of Tyrophagus putrescentiae]|nr:type IV secretion system protein [Wolbachia endosymbiont of Tyrophagus putrescentiae]